MSNNHYNLGYEFFQEKKNEVLSNEQLKQMHPLFRRGYRTAQEDYMKRNNRSFPVQLANIPTRSESYVPSWNDILAATRRPRLQKLHAPHMAPILNMLIKSVEDNKEQVKRYSDVVRMVEESFNVILQYGYDSGILDDKDLQQYNYIAK